MRILTRSSAASSASRESPSPSDPSMIAVRSRSRGSSSSGCASRRRRQCDDAEAVRSKCINSARPRARLRERHRKRRGHRRPDRFPVERIAARRPEHDRVGCKRGGASEDPADVVRIVDAFHHDHAVCAIESQINEGGRRRAMCKRKTAAMNIESCDAVHRLLIDEKNVDAFAVKAVL